MSPSRIASSLILFSCLATGCGSSGDDASPAAAIDDAPPLDADAAPVTIAQLVCERVETCGCDLGLTRSACEELVRTQLEADFARAEAAGLRADPVCLGKSAAIIDLLGCAEELEFDAEGDALARELWQAFVDALYCKPFSGSVVAGGQCQEDEDLGDDCVPSALCVDDVCTTIPEPAAVGEPCEDDFTFFAVACELGASCIDVDGDDDNRCVLVPEAGEPCAGERELCDGDSQCEAGVCVALPGPGEPCDFGCRGDLVCDIEAEVCVDLAAQGESCALIPCGGGLECSEAQVCEQEPPSICEAEYFE